jgi:CRISPR-associated endonuclease/helicase Cas3
LVKEEMILPENPVVTIQTGERPEDSKLEGDLIFTTIDQTLSNFLCIPYALSNRQANLNAGAIVSSYLVFDEFHLYDPRAVETTLLMLKMLKGVTPFLLMTATFSAKMLGELEKELGAVVIPQNDEQRQQMQALKSQQKTRRYHTVEALLTADKVLAYHPKTDSDFGRSIAICNTVDRAWHLFDGLRQHPDKPAEVKVVLLHSRFYKNDRNIKENWLRNEFGQNKEQYQARSAIFVATQVVEVGLDITCDVLHTELAPANAVLQRAGRCARYEKESGDVYIYRLPVKEDEEGEVKVQYAPYHQHGQAEICELTWQAFAQEGRQNQVLTFIEEQTILSETHGAADERQIQELRDNRFIHEDMMAEAMGYQERGLIRELIREVNNCNVIVHPNPNDDMDEKEPDRIKNPWIWESFSLFRGSVYKAYKELQLLATLVGHNEWVMMRLYQQEDPEQTGQDKIWYKWKEVKEQNELDGALVVAVHPHLASYDQENGLRLAVNYGQTWMVEPRPYTPKRNDDRYQYWRETYQEHIAGLYKAYTQPMFQHNFKRERVTRQPLNGDMAYTFARAERQLNLPVGMLDRVVRFIIAGHDLGKLGQDWQLWVHDWQTLDGVDNPAPDEMMLAHTDNYTDEHEKLEKVFKKAHGSKPPHAAESAFALLEATIELCGEDNEALFRAINTAITRHHGAKHQGSVERLKVSPYGLVALREAFQKVGLASMSLDVIQSDFEETEDLSYLLVEPEKSSEMFLYFLLARVLRLADQRSQTHG